MATVTSSGNGVDVNDFSEKRILMSIGSATDGSEQTLSDTHTWLSWKGLPTITSAVLNRAGPSLAQSDVNSGRRDSSSLTHAGSILYLVCCAQAPSKVAA